MSDTVYLVICGMAAKIENVIGPFEQKSDAEVAAKAIRQLPRKGKAHLWGERDTWVRIQDREIIE